MSAAPLHVLLIEDALADVCLIEELVSANPALRLTVADSVATGCEIIRTTRVDTTLLDLALPGADNADALDLVQAEAPAMPVIILTSEHDEGLAIAAVERGAQDYLVKGDFDERLLARSVRYAVGRAKTYALLSESEAKYRQLHENVKAGVFQTTLEGKIISANPALVALLGYDSVAELMAIRAVSDLWVNPEERDELVKTIKIKQSVVNAEIRLKRKDGTQIVALESAYVVCRAGRTLIEGTLIDITERIEAEERLSVLAQYDGLTGLANRYLFTDGLAGAIARAAREQKSLGVLMLDLDRFKEVNDTLGHSAGDELLKQVADRLYSCLRRGDLIARLGGDEFAVLLERVSCASLFAKVAQKIVAKISEPFDINGQEVFVTTSIGVATCPDSGITTEALMKAADVAMYKAKTNGKNAFHFYSESIHGEVTRRVDLERHLRLAMMKRELRLEYQPKISMHTGRVVGLEALLRWKSPKFGTVGPMEFVPVLEQTGIICEVGAWVMAKACAALRTWHDRLGHHNLSISVNVSARQLRDYNIVDDVAAALDSSGIAPSRLQLEVTETALMADAQRCNEVLHALKDMGVRIAIDDFGTGYSSLQYIKALPMHELKIDRVFVKDLEKDATDLAIIKATVAMAKSLGLKVTAEGVETNRQSEMLSACGCDYAQGFLYSRPLDPMQIDCLLAPSSVDEIALAV